MEFYYAESVHGVFKNIYEKRIELPLSEWLECYNKNCIHLGFEGDSYKIVRLPSPHAKKREKQYLASIIYLRPVK